MTVKLPQTPVLQTVAGRIGAAHYNRVRLARHRLGEPLTLMLPGLRGFQVCIGRAHWVCRDHSLGDLPILAWTDFAPFARNGLSQPVPCRLLHYHPYARVVLRTVLDDVVKILSARLRRAGETQLPGRVVPFAAEGRARAS
jgi:hypothetical protein